MHTTTDTEQILEFDKIKEQWATHALTEAAKEKILSTTPYLAEAELLKCQKQTTEARAMIEKCGTDPAEGMGIAIAVLDELKKSGALFLVTTHYPEVKQYASKTPSVINARMDFDKKNLKPLYKLIIGESGESYAQNHKTKNRICNYR